MSELMDTNDYIEVKSSQLNFYRKIPFYYENRRGDFALYKPIGVTLSEMRIRERMHPKRLYIKRKSKIEAIQEVQKQYNREIKKCINENDFMKVRSIVQSLVQTTLEEPVTGSLEGVGTTVDILVGEVTKNRDIVKVTCPPETGPDFVREMWHNLRPRLGGGHEPQEVYYREDYRDAT